MILVDIGNSGLRATQVTDQELFTDQNVYRLSWSAAVASHRNPTPEQESAPNQLWCELRDHSAFDWLVSQFSASRNEHWLISCVQRTALEELNRSLVKHGFRDMTKVVVHSDLSMKLDVDEPAKTGIDRLLAAWAAYDCTYAQNQPNGPIIVIQAGTAVTVDFVNSEGVFCGGAIMPGLGLSLQLLAAGTDQLPWLGNHFVDILPELPGKNTVQAISAGVNAALVGGASHLVQRYRDQSPNGPNVKVVVTGGDGSLLLPHIVKPAEFVEHLVLRGLCMLRRFAVRSEH
jgi:type III pantothenate kinase